MKEALKEHFVISCYVLVIIIFAAIIRDLVLYIHPAGHITDNDVIFIVILYFCISLYRRK